MTESEWDKFFEDGVLTPTRIVNSLWYSKDDVEAYLKEVKAVGDRLQKERDLFELKYKGMDKINQFNIQEGDKEHEKLEAIEKWYLRMGRRQIMKKGDWVELQDIILGVDIE